MQNDPSSRHLMLTGHSRDKASTLLAEFEKSDFITVNETGRRLVVRELRRQPPAKFDAADLVDRCPSSNALALGQRRPASGRSRLDFPKPFGPTSASTLSSSTARLT